MECGTSAATTANPSLTPPGEPGKFTIRVRPRVPAIPRDNNALGNFGYAVIRSASAIPGTSR